MVFSSTIFGYNSPFAVCIAENKVFFGAGGGVIVCQGNESTQWVPSDGRYPIDRLICSSSAALLCLTEVRLGVVLHVFRYPDFARLQRIDDVARSNVQDLMFSPSGHLLALLACTPTTCVTLFFVQRGRSLEKCSAVDLGGSFMKQLSFPFMRTDCLSVLGSKEVVILSHLPLASSTLSLPRSSSPSSTPCSVLTIRASSYALSCCSWGTLGVVCGTKEGEVILIDELDMETRVLFSCPTNGAISAVTCANSLILVGTEGGKVFCYDVQLGELRSLFDATHLVERILFSENGSTAVVITNTQVTRLHVSDGSASMIRFRCSGETAQLLAIGPFAAIVCTSGNISLFDKESNCVTEYSVDVCDGALSACIVGSNVITVTYESGSIRSFTLKSTLTLTSCVQIADAPLTCCATDDESTLVTSDESTIYLLTVKRGFLFFQHSIEIFSSKVVKLKWISNERSILASCVNGEVQLIRCFDSAEEGAATIVIETVWRLDFPVTYLLPLYVDDDVINILVHSMDKDTKLYVLERRRDREMKPLRPLFLMRDHDSGGIVLQRLGESSVISGGGDGKVVVREVGHYLSRLTPIPPSKEKRRPSAEFSLRPYGKKSLSSLCVWGEDGGFFCGSGDDPVVHVVYSTGSTQNTWIEPSWCSHRLLSSLDTAKDSVTEETTSTAERYRSRLLSSLVDLRVDVEKLLAERTPAVRAEDFLLPDEQDAFREECDSSIHKAKEDDYYSLLFNDFIQDILRRECWEAMEVPRSKIVSLKDPALEVHNFHLQKTKAADTSILKKVKFLRSMQLRDENSFTFSECLKVVDNVVPKEAREASESGNDVDSLLFDSIDVYTHARSTIQMILLHGKIFHVKTAFNAKFDSLREFKSRELDRIEERNERCKRIMKQLGEVLSDSTPLFKPHFDREEDPKTVFEVFDSEIDPELLKLASKKNCTTNIISAASEAALRTWMDGLEKDTEVIAVHLPIPPFADESLEQYVPPDERTDEQQREYEEYGKRLAEQVILVNERKEALRQEMINLQNANTTGANTIDEKLISLRKERLGAAQLIDELELHQVNALRRLLLPTVIFNELLSVLDRKHNLEQRLKQLEGLEEHRRGKLVASEAQRDSYVEKEKTLAIHLRSSSPFDDLDWGDRLYKRFNRWRAKYEIGEATIPQVHQNDTIPSDIWAQYCNSCQAIVEAKEDIDSAEVGVKALSESLSEVESEMARVRSLIDEEKNAEETHRQTVVRRILDIQNLYSLRQGQVQDESAIVNDEFACFSFRWEKDIVDYNDLIYSSFEELRRLMGRISQQRHTIKMCSWETERLQYCVGTLEMELRQLHTLRVTRQMQESIHYGATTTRQGEIDKLNRQIGCVRSVMSKRVEERNRVIARLRMQINDRKVENRLLKDQVDRAKSAVDDKKAVWSMLGEHSNEGKRIRCRMLELRENSELEELARCQQEELVELKCEIDRLRERTFPSFAVVTKKTVR